MLVVVVDAFPLPYSNHNILYVYILHCYAGVLFTVSQIMGVAMRTDDLVYVVVTMVVM